MIYEGIERNLDNIKELRDQVIVSHILGPKVTIRGNNNHEYRVEFIDKKNNFVIYQSNIKTNHWSKANVQYFTDWRIRVWKDNELFHQEDYNAEDKRVYISLSSSAIGDTLAWFPYAEKFKEKHNCELIVSTFHNDLFEEKYPDIEFVKPGQTVENIYAQYSIGFFYNEDDTINIYKNPQDPKTIPMQQVATDILGLEYEEVKPRIKKTKQRKKPDLVTIAIHGTTQAKYWNNSNGWNEVVAYLKCRGYRVKLLSREGDGYMGNSHPKGLEQLPEGSLENVVKELRQSKFFIGIGSGLAWLSWAVGTPTVMISGFSEGWTEMKDCIRIEAPEGKCSGCFNRVRLDAGDWNWCPEHKGTDRQFECTKSITGQDVINKLIARELV